MIKKEMAVYICDHCGKIFKDKEACELHEYWCEMRPYPERNNYEAKRK